MKKVIILILLIFAANNSKAQFFGDMLYSEIDPLSTAHIRVGNYGSGELVSGSVYNNVDSAVKYSPPGSLITIMPGAYTTKIFKIDKSLNIYCKSGVVISGDSVARRILIGDTVGAGKNVNVTIKGYANFTNLSLQLFGSDVHMPLPLTQTTLFFECNIFNAGTRSCFYWANVKDINVKFRKAIGGTNVFDCDDYTVNAQFEGDTVICTLSMLMNLHVTNHLNIKFVNMHIVDSGNESSYIELVDPNKSNIEFDNVTLSGINPIEFVDQYDAGSLTKWIFKNSIFNFTGDNSFLINSDYDAPLISVNSSTNKPIGGYHTFAPIIGDFTSP